jgi:hypothetical protein
VHADNARPHATRLSPQFFAENRMKPAANGPYFPDLAPSDFYRFSYVKASLAGRSFDDTVKLFEAVQIIVEGLERTTLQSVFLEQMERLSKCIATNGEYAD